MNLSVGKTEVRKLAEVMDGEFSSLEEAAEATLRAAWELYEAKSKFVVAGQLRFSDEHGRIHHDDQRADLVCLGPYGTRKQAEGAGSSLAIAPQGHEEFVWWVLPINHGTPFAWHQARKKAREGTAKEDLAARRVKTIVDREEERLRSA